MMTDLASMEITNVKERGFVMSERKVFCEECRNDVTLEGEVKNDRARIHV